MITNIKYNKGINSTEQNLLATYAGTVSGVINAATIVNNTTIFNSPDTKSIAVTTSKITKENWVLNINLATKNTEIKLDFDIFRNILLFPSGGWPQLTFTIKNGELVKTIQTANMTLAYNVWQTHSIIVRPNWDVDYISIQIGIDWKTSSLVNLVYYLSNPTLSYLNNIGNPVNNPVILDFIDNDFRAFNSDTLFNLYNLNTTPKTLIAKNIQCPKYNYSKTSYDFRSLADVSPILRNVIELNRKTIYKADTLIDVTASNDWSGIVPIEIEAWVKFRGQKAINTTFNFANNNVTIEFQNPQKNNFNIGHIVSYFNSYTPAIVPADPDINDPFINMFKVKSKTINGSGLVTHIVIEPNEPLTLVGPPVYDNRTNVQLQGDLLERSETTKASYKTLYVYKGSLSDYEYNNFSYFGNNFKGKIVSCFPTGEKRKVRIGDLELLTLWNNPIDNLQSIEFPDDQTTDISSFGVNLNSTGVDNAKNLQLDIKWIVNNTSSTTDKVLTIFSQDSQIEYPIEFICKSEIADTTEYINDKDYIKLFWINKFGGWDSYYFKKISENSAIELNTFYNKVEANPLDNCNTTYNGSVLKSIKISTDFMTRKISLWIRELFESGYVFLYENINGNHKLIPVLISEPNWSSLPKGDVIRIIDFDIQLSNIKRVNL